MQRAKPVRIAVIEVRAAPQQMSSLGDIRLGNVMKPRLLRNCPIWPRNETGLARWYDDYKQRTSERLRAWGGCSIEVDIERDDLTARLDRFFAMNASAECLATHTHASRISYYAPPRG